MEEMSRQQMRSRSGGRPRLNRFAASLAALALVLGAGCAAPQRPKPAPAPAPVTVPVDAPSAVLPPQTVERGPVTNARDLLPDEDLSLTFTYQDGSQSQEVLIAESDRVVQAKGENAFLQWNLRDGGVWRPDLTGFDRRTLLLFLPDQLVDGLTWQQYTPHAGIDFRLTSLAQCGSAAVRLTHCWRVDVINPYAVTAYELAPGLGVVRAVSYHEDAAESYEKVLTEWSVARLDAAGRKRLLEQGQALHDSEPHPKKVQRGSSDFQSYLDRRREEMACGTPSTGRPVLPGASGQVAFLCGGKLWSMDLATGRQTRLYAPGVPVNDFAMEPRGRGYAVSVPVGKGGEVRYIERDPARPRLMYVDESWEVGLPLHWSPDGKTLVIDRGTSRQRVYHFIDAASGRKLGQTMGMDLQWSPDGTRYALVKGVYIPNDGVEGGSSRTLVVGEVRTGQLKEWVQARGTVEAGYEPLGFTSDGTLVYKQFVPTREDQDTYWALAPATGASPERLDAASPLVKAVGVSTRQARIVVDGKSALRVGNSPDGKWTMFIFNNFGEAYLIASSLQGAYVRLPGSMHEWIRP